MSSLVANMPRPAALPTPQPSTEIASKSDGHTTTFDASFSLGPAALREGTTSSTTSNSSDSSYNPASPNLNSKPSPPNPRKRPSASLQSATVQDGYTLPPPPTRSRKIIQMKPQAKQQQQQQPQDVEHQTKPTEPPTPTSANGKSTGGGKKKQGSGNTAAGRKMARKTAHSLIERRRRSKMNEEFGVLKDMIPACAGQEMHKLAILQASIEYMRYLEQCLTDLKASTGHGNSISSSAKPTPRESTNATPQPSRNLDESSDEDEDEAMEDDAISPTTLPTMRHTFPPLPPSSATSPILYANRSNPHSTTTSPNMVPTTDPRHYSITSSIRSTVTSPSILPSPAFSSSGHTAPPFPPTGHSTSARFALLTSPALHPQTGNSVQSTNSNVNDHGKPGLQRDQRMSEDQEATAALLMLNSDRRNWHNGARGMSVRDLLSG
ncbi:hypothetical protein EJ05DRAFT_535017 [Pseudovirgaria hyperparasitica]|uniref:BHLH domain-containing protein n=1 Tax=Pseudovirgaria hyperparasitica TaxID=470096 RepID=A0A6A6WIW5_9PEZI|nr:uncharacterized protein EJ05DRAFT_535017 [Pseudovirgaria hyperparasitica]KAF2761647.1 hypothetical protein EJ05DRAFT_535017 [Pseudovirgaria hyperparasitica]